MQSPSTRQSAPTQVEPSYRQLRRAMAAEEQRWQVEPTRSGLLGFWLNLAAPPPVSPLASFAERERQRKAELSAYVAFGVLLIGLALIPNALQSANDLYAIPAIFGSGIVAVALNRHGFTRTAAVILIAVFFVAIGGAMAASPNLDLMWIPALDFFAVPVFLSGLLLSRRAPFGATAVGAALIVTLLLLKPRDAWLGHMVSQLGVYHFMVRPIGLMLIVAIASWLWGRSVEQAIMRADRAEEVAAMEHQLAEQKRQLDRGIQNLLETHVRVSNGDFSARAVTNQDNVLWQIAVSLNNLLSRLGKYASVEQRLGRTEAEIDRLATSMENTRLGRNPNWPLPSGTRVDRLLALVATQPQARHAPTSWPPTPVSQHYPPRRPAQVPHAPAASSNLSMDSDRTRTITGKWREVSDAVQGHSANAAERQSEQVRQAPWMQPQAEYRPAPEAPAHWLANPANGVWHEPAGPTWSDDRPTTAGPAAGWEMDPLPPLAPLPESARADLSMQHETPGHASGSPRSGGGHFAESFPGQLREGASWADLRGLNEAPEPGAGDASPSASNAPSSQTAQNETSEWPDWPSFLRNLDAQTDD